MTKQEEYNLMLNSKHHDLITPVKNSKEIKWMRTWDLRKTMAKTTFKTLMPPPYEHKLISVEEIDLLPMANYKIYKITIKNN